MRTASAVSVYVTKNPRTAAIPCVSANGATNVETAAAARLPTESTPMTTARLPARPRVTPAGCRRDVDATPVDRRRQYQAPTSATPADRTNNGRAPKRVAIG